ncbi:hypothetical protein EC991_005247 [Linnemannia zychae]|nr:hypothetical protein EC991_005247 [Linnemannia zychae]
MITISLGEDVFKWAVKLRKEYGPNNEDTKSSASGLFPLRHYNVRYKEPAYGPQINDIAYAFSNTLEELYISGPFSSDLGNTLHVPKFSLGCSDNGDNEGDVPSWPILPRLRTMWAEMDYTFIRIHRRLLSQLPRLTSLNLNDRLDQYSLANVVHWEPTNFPKLRDLTLCGTPAICFHPDTLKNTPKLGKLDLSLHNIGDYSFIPDPEEFEAVEQRQDSSDGDSNVYLDDNSSSIPPLPKQPVWTWDWDLPRLTYLRLTAEFAYRFQFQMLAGTPNLVSLSLDIKSLSRGHRRTVGTSDFVKPVFKRPALARILNKGPEQQEETIRLPYWDTEAYYDDRNVQPNDGTEDEENEVSQEFEFLHVPALVSINIIGPWRFDHHALETLFSKVAPGIQYVRFPGCYGFTILEWVQSTSENLHYLQWGYTTIQFCPQMAAEAGLVRDRGPNMFGRIDYKLTERPVGRVLQNHALYHFR